MVGVDLAVASGNAADADNLTRMAVLKGKCTKFTAMGVATDPTLCLGKLVRCRLRVRVSSRSNSALCGAPHNAEFERSLIRERTQAGLLAAKRAGRTGGRPPKLTDEDIEAARAMLTNPNIGVASVANRLGVSLATLYRYIPAARASTTESVSP